LEWEHSLNVIRKVFQVTWKGTGREDYCQLTRLHTCHARAHMASTCMLQHFEVLPFAHGAHELFVLILKEEDDTIQRKIK
jgi:hypothetical protein